MNIHGNLYIVSAPSGAGKTSLLKALTTKIADISTSISTTTRIIRPGEIDGQDYHFVSKEDFTAMIEHNEFIEHANVFGNYYGTSFTSINEVLQTGCDLVLEIDWQGAQQVRKQVADVLSIFILPPSRNELVTRLTGRGQDNAEVIRKRMDAAIAEISHYDEYDYLVINDDFDIALTDLESIIKANRLLLSKQSVTQSQLIAELL